MWSKLDGRKDSQGITSDWTMIENPLIQGVSIREVKNVPTGYGYLTELYRKDWQLDSSDVSQIFQSILFPGKISAWHAHENTTDRIFVTWGLVKIVLFDERSDSPTKGLVNEFTFGTVRPAMLVIPPKVWHGIQNVSPEISIILNAVDLAYHYENPDHWRVELNSSQIPYHWNE